MLYVFIGTLFQNLLKIIKYEEDAKLNSHVLEKREKEINMISEPQEWGGWFGTLILIFFTPLITILPQLMCTQNKCKFEYPDIPTDLNSYINLKAFVTYLGFFLFVTIVSISPIGTKVDGPQSRIGRLQYRLNGSSALVFEFLTILKTECLNKIVIFIVFQDFYALFYR